jgi:hypothetical protein
MANYYANINNSYTGSSHAGTLGDPFSFADLQAHSLANTSGNVYYIIGQRSGFSDSNGLYVMDNTWCGYNLSVNGPWRVQGLVTSNLSLNMTGTGTISDAIIYNTGYITFIRNVSNSVIISVLGGGNHGIGFGAGYIKGCHIFGRFTLNNSANIDIYDSAFNESINLGTGTKNVYNSAFVALPIGYTVLSNCQTDWNGVDMPVWDAAKADLSSAILNAGISIPPQYGNYPYTNYATGLWGEPRLGIGGANFPAEISNQKFWADVSLATDGHAGTIVDPFSLNDLNAHSGANPNFGGTSNYYICKGYYHSTEIITLLINGNRWVGWATDIEEDDIGSIILNFSNIWRIESDVEIDAMSGMPGTVYNLISNGYFSADIFNFEGIGVIVNSIFSEGLLTIANNGKCYGSSFYGTITDNGFTASNIYNCVLNDISNSGNPGAIDLLNCACVSTAIEDDYNTLYCQFGWTMPSAPDIISGNFVDYRNLLLCAGVTTPPEPGTLESGHYYADCENYNYDYGLFGTPRIGIGAVYFEVKAATPTITPGTSSYTNPLSITISTATEGAIIYYTIDGSAPTTSSILYSRAIAVDSPTTPITIRAIAIATGYLNSDIALATYTFYCNDGSYVPQTYVLDIIKRAMRLLGVLAEGETPVAEATQNFFQILNWMVDEWCNDRLLIYHILNETFPIYSGRGTYTIGPDATCDFNTANPVQITTAFCRDAVASQYQHDYMLEIIPNDRYQDIFQKTIQATYPRYLNFVRQWPYGQINIWPVPMKNYTLGLSQYKQIRKFTSVNQVVCFPPGYKDALAISLASKMAPEYGKDESTINRLDAMAIKAKEGIKTTNWEDILLSTDDMLVTRRMYTAYPYRT